MLLFLTIVLLVISLLLVFIIISFFFFAIDLFLDLPYVATKKEKIKTIIKLAQIGRGDTVIDLGSGDGRLLFAAAGKGAKSIGYEINPFLIIFTRIGARIKDLDHSRSAPRNSRAHSGSVMVKRQNLWKADLKVADVIFVYGRRKDMQKFEAFVFQNAKKGTRIIVNTNPFPSKKPQKSENNIFLYYK